MPDWSAPIKGRTPYDNARREYAWLLRAEGTTYQEIGRRLGVSATMAKHMVRRFGINAERMSRRCKWKFVMTADYANAGLQETISDVL